MNDIRGDLANILAEDLNKNSKSDKIAFFLDGHSSTPVDITGWVSTGSSLLDLAISNRKNGGLPVGRITELTGLEASGKSLVAAHLLADTQRQGGVAVFIDTEAAVSTEFLSAIGVDTEKMLYIPLDLVEDIFQVIENLIVKIRNSDKNRLVTIVVDSVAAATTEVESEADYGKDGWATSKAIVMSKAMRKITNMISKQRICLVFTNQLRVKMGVSFGDPYTTSGGKALGFHSSVRIRLKQVGQIKQKISGREEVVGIKTRAHVIKNRVGPPLRNADFNIFFDSGIDDYGGWLELMKSFDIVKQGGAWYRIEGFKEEPVKFQSKDFSSILENDPELKDYLYDKICENVIMTYRKNPETRVDDIEISDGEIIDE